MELTHTFTVPGSVEQTWDRFGDIASLAECFPGAQVDRVEQGDSGESFSGSCKVKLGPIALVYAGSGTFVERDEAARRMVVEAKGRDKRGNGTAGATVTVTMEPAEPASTKVEVLTDLSITGKPAQFGRGVMQDVSDKLLGQFVACLEQRSHDAAGSSPDGGGEDDVDPDAGPASVPTGAAAGAAASPGAGPDAGAADPDAGPASVPGPAARSGSTIGGDRPAAESDALDLGATVLPVLLRGYWKQGLGALVVVLVLTRLLGRRRRG